MPPSPPLDCSVDSSPAKAVPNYSVNSVNMAIPAFIPSFLELAPKKPLTNPLIAAFALSPADEILFFVKTSIFDV